jgi:Flp pilus assembly protein CpaB
MRRLGASAQATIYHRKPVMVERLCLLILGALVALIIALYKLRAAPIPTSKPVIVAEFDTVSVPVPVEPIPVGTLLRKIQFKNIPYPKHQLPEGAVRDLSPFLDSVNTVPLPASLPVFASNLSLTALKTNPVLEQISEGLRAMAIRVDATSAVEGWAATGSLVDVLLVTPEKTLVVAEKVRILSTERSTTPVEGAHTPNVPSTTTILVTQEQCLAINTAIPMGKIALVLRGLRDDKSWNNTSYSKEQLKRQGQTDSTLSRSINGVVEITGAPGDSFRKRSFALTDGRWVQTRAHPEGFLINRPSAADEENQNAQ